MLPTSVKFDVFLNKGGCMDKQDSRPTHQVIYVQLLGAELSWMAGKDGKKAALDQCIEVGVISQSSDPVIRWTSASA